jgi:hypothetical protein
MAADISERELSRAVEIYDFQMEHELQSAV